MHEHVKIKAREKNLLAQKLVVKSIVKTFTRS